MLGALVAISAALAFGVGAVLQKIGAPPAHAVGLRRLVAHVVTSPPYLVGTGLDIVGFVLTAVAARQLALFAVEGILSTSVGVTAVLAVWLLGERLRSPAKVAVSLMVVGLVLLSLTAAPETGTTLGLPLAVLAAAGASLVILVALADRRPASPATCSVLAVVSGLAFGTWAAVPRLTFDGPSANAVGVALLVVGLISYAAALRRGSAVSVMAITVAAESVLPALCGLAAGDRARPGVEGVALAGFVMAVASAIVLALLDGRSSTPAGSMAPARVRDALPPALPL